MTSDLNFYSKKKNYFKKEVKCYAHKKNQTNKNKSKSHIIFSDIWNYLQILSINGPQRNSQPDLYFADYILSHHIIKPSTLVEILFLKIKNTLLNSL